MACAVKACKSHSSRKDTEGKNISFHRFPNNELLKNLWIKAIGEVGWTPKSHNRICSMHFESNCYVIGDVHNKLHYNAVPSLHLNSTSMEDPLDIEDMPITTKTSWKCHNCVALKQRVNLLEKQVIKLQLLAKRRLRKIKTISESSRRLKKRNSEMGDTISALLEHVNSTRGIY